MLLRSRTTVLALAATLIAGLTLSGCAPQPDPQPTTAATTAPGPVAEPSASAAPDKGGPIDLACSALITDEAMYEFSPNYGLDDSWKPAAGSLAHKAVTLGGTACAWRNETGGELIIVAAAHPDAATFATLGTAAGLSSADTRTFDVRGDLGTAQSFERGFWVIAESTEFLELVDAAPLVKAANSALR